MMHNLESTHDKNEFLKLNTSKKGKRAQACVRVVTFPQGDFLIAYAPSLNLSSYGKTDEEAFEMLGSVVLRDYLVTLIELPESQIMAELRQFGWKRRPLLAKELLNTNAFSPERLIEDFDLPADTRFDERFVTA